jgi:putative phosphonate metabolism protein
MAQQNGNSGRYGIYFSPAPGALLHEQGSRWLGRDAVTGEVLDPDLPHDLSPDSWRDATESPRRYGLHATLKPPFRLAKGFRFEDLHTALHEFAGAHDRFDAPSLKVGTLGRFLALTLSEPCQGFVDLAADCVSGFDRFRAPAAKEEIEKRLNGRLSAREREHVLRWGYPYVFDTWKFHISLTGPMAAHCLPFFEQHLRERFSVVNQRALPVDSVSIFHEPHAGAPFRIVDRANLRSL